jgi:type I restriction enzyme S subunit
MSRWSLRQKNTRGYLVQAGDVVVGMDGEFRAHRWRGPQAWLNQRLCCLRPKPGFPRTWLHYSIEGSLNFFERSKTGTTVIHLGKGDVDTFRVLVPGRALIEAFGVIVDPLDARMRLVSQHSRTLAALRDTLLPRLIAGEIRVKDAERIASRMGA